MPVYDYKCSDHGLFYELASMENHAEPAKCPECQTLCPRVIIIPPALQAIAKEQMEGIERNEKAQHEPEFSTIESRVENEEKLKKGCGCSHKKRASKLMYTAQGDKMFPSMRPWMISH